MSMAMTMRFPRLILILCTVARSCLAQQPVTTLFQIDFTGTADGGCLNAGQTVLQNHLADSLTLANAGVALLNAYTTNEAALRLVDAFFKEPSIGTRKNIANSYSSVANFLSNNQGSPSGGTPWLLCDSNWLTRVVNGVTLTKNSDTWDEKGPGNPVKDINGNVMSIYNAYKARWDAIAAGLAPRQVFPYWSNRLASYLLDQTYGGTTAGFCSQTSNKGVTQSQTSPNSITLCPRSFTAGTRVTIPGTINAVPNANIAAGNTANTVQLGTFINNADPVTLYHELFHLILGTDNTPDVDPYDVANLLSLAVTQAQATVNPETFVAASYAWYLTSNVAPVNNFPVEFYTGFATAG